MRGEKESGNNGLWKVLIVDDDNFMHKIIKETAKNIRFEEKSIIFYSAYTSEEAKDILKNDKDIALVLLDVFLERQDCGLELTKYIRDEIENTDIRIVLITGRKSRNFQEQIILNYDINGYENKSDLLPQKLNTIILSALRGYRDISLLENNRRAMEEVIKATSNLYKTDSIEEFLVRTVHHISYIINKSKFRKIYSINSFAAIRDEKSNSFKISYGNGKFAQSKNQDIRQILSQLDLMRASKVINSGKYEFYNDCYMARYRTTSKHEAIIYIEIDEDIDQIDKDLLDLFHRNILSTFENLCLNIEIEETQKEILYTLGEVTEARAEETGSHVKRVSKYCEVLAREYGLSKVETMLLTNAASIHDIGKVAVPDNILLKPGKLTKEEFEIMKTHTTIGYNLLKNSNRKILKTAAIVAYQHHERYDGRGYPRGLKGEEIHIYGRIAAIADVFDALGSSRTYKKPWLINDILKYFKEERGKHFDPKLVDIMFENLDEFLAIKKKYTDELSGAQNCEFK